MQAVDLTVSAAASLTSAFKDIATAFEEQHPGSKVLPNFGASDALLQQIVAGAPGYRQNKRYLRRHRVSATRRLDDHASEPSAKRQPGLTLRQRVACAWEPKRSTFPRRKPPRHDGGVRVPPNAGGGSPIHSVRSCRQRRNSTTANDSGA